MAAILAKLDEAYPNATCELNHKNAFELLIATILSAQCTDVRVNQVTGTLFKKYPDAKAFAYATPSELEQEIRRQIVAGLGIAVRAILLKPPRWLVKSTAGKAARSATREKLLQEHPELDTER